MDAPKWTSWTIGVTEIANRFHVVNNLASWNVSARPHYNCAWIEETGPLSAAEREALDAAREVFPRYGGGPSAVWGAFIAAQDEADAWARARGLVTSEDLQTLRQAMATLGPRFRLLWERDRPRLETVRERLEPALRAPGIAEAVAKLGRYLASAAPSVRIELLMSRGSGSAGGANGGRITLEVQECDDMAEAADVVVHELGHFMERAHFLPRYRSLAERHRLLERRGAPGWDAFVLVKEALHLSLCPSGCLSPLYGVPIRDHAGDATRARGAGYPRQAGLLELTSLVLPLVREYLDPERPVDDALLASGIAAFEANPHTLA